MFKKIGFVAFVFLILATLTSSVFADISLISPLDQTIKRNATVSFGSVAPGETFEIILTNGTGYGEEFLWTQAYVEIVPQGWNFEHSKLYDERPLVKIGVPKDALEGEYSFVVRMDNVDKKVVSESFQGKIYVKKDLQKASFDDLAKETVVKTPTLFELTIVNDSISDHSFSISSDLPQSWFSPQVVYVPKRSVKRVLLEVNPLVYGHREFKFFVDSKVNGLRIGEYQAKLSIKPTLKSKYDVGLIGFPIFNPGMEITYLLNSIISFFI